MSVSRTNPWTRPGPGELLIKMEMVTVDQFKVGDKIGHRADTELWIGEVVYSGWDEPLQDRWHLAWIDARRPGEVAHWKGAPTQRDTRWIVRDPTVISELP